MSMFFALSKKGACPYSAGYSRYLLPCCQRWKWPQGKSLKFGTPPKRWGGVQGARLLGSYGKCDCNRERIRYCHLLYIFKTFLAHLWGAYAVPLALSVVHHLCPPLLPEIIKISNPYLVQVFIILLDCAS